LQYYNVTHFLILRDGGNVSARNCVSLQIHPDQLAGFDKKVVCNFLQETGADVQVEDGRPEEDYINFNCWTEGSVLPVWKRIQQLFAAQPAIQNRSIVCCTGEHGWDDYLLLHGASEGETLDVLEG
jgi:hypothetical protein